MLLDNMKVVWTDTADLSYFKELNFIAEKWTDREVDNFMVLVDEFVEKLESKTLQGKILSHENMRSFVISKQTTLFFNYFEKSEIIELLFFWNNSQNPKELENILGGF